MAMLYNSRDISITTYPLVDEINEIDKKIDKLKEKMNKMARAQAKKVWTGSSKRRKK